MLGHVDGCFKVERQKKRTRTNNFHHRIVTASAVELIVAYDD
jgi:hypothetical protein